MTNIYTNADTAPMLSGLPLAKEQLLKYNKGRFGFERSLPENPALMNALLSAGMRMVVNINAAKEKPTEA